MIQQVVAVRDFGMSNGIQFFIPKEIANRGI